MSQAFQCRDMKELLNLLRNIAEAVDQFLCHIVHLFLCLDGGDPPVHIQLLILVFNIRLRNICIDVDIDGGAVVLLPAGPFQLEDRFVEHLAVEIISHCFHMPALCFSKKIPCSPDLKIPHGNLDPRAQIRELTDGGKALLCHLF